MSTVALLQTGRSSFFDRVAVVHDIGGPRVRLAVLWSGAVVVALLLAGTGGIALVFGATAGIGSLQVASRWRQAGEPANQILAVVGSVAVVAGAELGNAWCGLAILAFAIASVVFPERFEQVPFLAADEDGESTTDRVRHGLAHAANTLGPGLVMGLAGAAAVQSARVENMAFLFLFVAISTYDAGDFLCGAESRSRLVGPLCGILGIAVVTVVMYVAQPPPFEGAQTAWVGLVLALACPAGQWLGSWLLPTATTKAPGLRRLDTWSVAGPAFVVALWVVGH
jgi:hypothetical protein